jgi:phosphate-selective porin
MRDTISTLVTAALIMGLGANAARAQPTTDSTRSGSPDAAPPEPAPPQPAPPEPAATPPVVPSPAAPSPPAVQTGAPPALASDPLAGFADKFFVRSPDDRFVLYVGGRIMVDSRNYLNPGKLPDGVTASSSGDKRPKNTIFLRRARLELGGTIAEHYDFTLQGEIATTPDVGAYGTVTEAAINIDYSSYARLKVGQFSAPFTLDNATSSKYYSFMERSLPVRAIGIPGVFEIGAMVWGQPASKWAYYALGLFNGDGQNLNAQGRGPEVIGRGFVAPLAASAGTRRWRRELWLGGSVLRRDANNIGGAIAPSTSGRTQNDLNNMTTQGGIQFFSASYASHDAAGAAIRSHLVPNGVTAKWALEANAPVSDRVGLRAELIHSSMNIAQYHDTAMREGPFTGGRLTGLGYYVEAWAWAMGDMSIVPTPSLPGGSKLKHPLPAAKDPRLGLKLLAKYEHVGLDLHLPAIGSDAVQDPADGHYAIDAFSLGADAWPSTQVRLTVNYVMNFIGGLGARAGSSALMKSNYYYVDPPDGSGRPTVDHELSLRVQIGF